ncbi:MAG: response regulator transcription factor [Betaproteobacteria bacterium]
MLVLDDGTTDCFVDPDSAVSIGDVEVIGTLRITSCSALAPAVVAAGADIPGDILGLRAVLRESPAVSPKDSSASSGGAGGGAWAGQEEAAPFERDAAVYLTRTELDVLRLLAKGLRNKDIAQELYISVNTVKTHVASIFKKLRVKNRSQAVRYVWSRGVR